MTDNRKARAKHFQISKCKKGIKQRQSLNKRSKRRRKYIASRSYVHNVSYRQHPFSALQQSTHRLIAPAFLSISDNPDETLNFFDYVSRTVERCKRGDHLFFDLSQIVTITPDAIMYLIAFINNAKRIRALQISSSGNLPNDTGAKDIMLKTGFYSHVKSRFQETPETDNNYMKISSGKDADGNLASAFCDFVQEKCSQGMSGTKKLYPIIIELMTNTHQHAYKDRLKSIMDNIGLILFCNIIICPQNWLTLPENSSSIRMSCFLFAWRLELSSRVLSLLLSLPQISYHIISSAR